ncbi:hypothetical protein DM01DRAFT_307549 [Hesseltinella vesiculosa]|uniref:Uncharacterized protein n=1 Tax=Hesseltinella vesiculosa TaxID=101127 RepID=A0A1X2GMB3_9FUNG|nr:hypothetical protein DM01DRAFT_307549 [Hesseltinella vesiculosa]
MELRTAMHVWSFFSIENPVTSSFFSLGCAHRYQAKSHSSPRSKSHVFAILGWPP